MKLNATLRRDFQERTDRRVAHAVKWDAKHRRHFLLGSGGAMLALPFLPSLFPRGAQAQAARQKSFIGIPAFNGMTDGYSASEAEAKVKPSVVMPSYIGMTPNAVPGKYTIYSKDLVAAKDANPRGQISDLIDSSFNPLLPKMLMLQGFDYLFRLGHHFMHFCGNHNTGSEITSVCPPMPSIDQVMAYSKNFYKNPALLGRSATWTSSTRDAGYPSPSSTYADPANKTTSKIVLPSAITSPQVLWDKYFGSFTAPPAGPNKRKLVADAVLTQYKSLLGNPALGGEDKKKIQRHVDLINATQTQVSASMGCTKPARPGATPVTDFPSRTKMLQTMNDVIVSLIACGLCHSFTAQTWTYLVDDPEIWHTWSHQGPLTSERQLLGGIYKDVGLDLAKKLDTQGLLDDSLIFIPQEHSKERHESWNASVIMFGGAGGMLKTGQYVDYRDMQSGNDTGNTRSGYIMNQLWANVLQAMDVPPSEFEPLNRTGNSLFGPANSGYGQNQMPFPTYESGPFARQHVTFKGANLSTWLPLIKA